MALIWMDSFDYSDITPNISTNNAVWMLRRRYRFVDLTSFEDGFMVTGAHGGTGLQTGHSNQFIRTKKLRDLTVDEEGIIGFRMKIHEDEAIKNNATWMCAYAGDRDQLCLRVNQNGSLSVYRDNSTFLETSDPGLFQPNEGWSYVEWKFRIHNTLGNWEFRKDGVVVWTSGTYNTNVFGTQGVFWDNIAIWGAGVADDTIMDDMYVVDASGSVNNDYLGPIVVESLTPDADGDSSTWTPSSGTNHAALVDDCIDMTDALAETDYIEGDTTGDKDLFTYTNLSSPGLADASSIHGVQVTTYRRITASAPADLKIVAKENGTEGSVTETVRHDHTSRVFSSQVIFENNPDSASAWTPAEIDAAQFGVEIP